VISIKVLGYGCADCSKLAEVAQHAADFIGAGATVQQVSAMAEVRKYRIMADPGLVINEKVVCAGRIPTAGEVTTGSQMP
jgi:hypothetical protein